MNAPLLSKTAKPLTIALTSLLILTLISPASAAQTISATYSLHGNNTTSVNREYSLTGLHVYSVSESRNASMSASGTVTVVWMTDSRSANGSITITRNAAFRIVLNGTNPQTGTESETSTITFSGSAEEASDFFGPLMGHPTGTLENVTINGQTYLAVHAFRNFTDTFTASAQETFTKTGSGGQTITVTVNKNVTRNVSIIANFWFSKTSGILLKSAFQGSISFKVSVNGTITGPLGGSESFSMTANYSDTFSRTVMATSITGLSG
jgi:hypothetical protein